MVEVEGAEAHCYDTKATCTGLDCARVACSSDTRVERCQSKLMALKVFMVQ